MSKFGKLTYKYNNYKHTKYFWSIDRAENSSDGRLFCFHSRLAVTIPFKEMMKEIWRSIYE